MVKLKDIINSETEYIVVDEENSETDTITGDICKASDSIVDKCENKNFYIEAPRVNELGLYLEDVIVDEFNDISSRHEATKLSSNGGYPDIKITGGEYDFYLEIKCTQSNWGQQARSFYLSSFSNLDSDGYHYLLSFGVDNVSKNKWVANEWKLVKISNLELTSKIEYNTGNKTIYDKDHIVESS